MKEGLAWNHSGATAPELHRFLRFISKTNLTLCLPMMSVKGSPDPAEDGVNRSTSFIAHAATGAQRHAAFPLDELITEREQAGIVGRGGKIWRSSFSGSPDVFCGDYVLRMLEPSPDLI